MSDGEAADEPDRSSRDESASERDNGNEHATENEHGNGRDRADRFDSERLSTSTPQRGRRRYDQSREADSSPLGPFVVSLVGGSAGLIALQTGATLVEIGLSVIAGAAIGAALWWYLRRLGQEMPNRRPSR